MTNRDMTRLRVLKALNLLVSLAVLSSALLSVTTRALAAEGDFRRVTLTEVKASKNEKGKWVLVVSGECPRVPKGTKMKLDLTWRSSVVESFKITTTGASFKNEFVLKKATAVVGDEIELQTAIVKSEQSSSVKRKIDDDKVAFPPKVKRYVDHHIGSGFVIGSSEDIAKRHKFARDYFKERLGKLKAIDDLVLEKTTAIDEATAMVNKDGELQVKEWHKWFESEVVEKLKDLQAEVETHYADLRYKPYLTALADLQEVSAAVARRALQKQEDVFRKANQELAEKYRHTEEKDGALDSYTRTRRVPGRAYLNKVAARIAEAVGGFGKKKKADPEEPRPRDKPKKKPQD